MKSILYLLLFLVPVIGFSQEKPSRFHIDGVLGLNIGAPIPDDVGSAPEGTTGSPGAKIAVGLISELMLNN